MSAGTIQKHADRLYDLLHEPGNPVTAYVVKFRKQQVIRERISALCHQLLDAVDPALRDDFREYLTHEWEGPPPPELAQRFGDGVLRNSEAVKIFNRIAKEYEALDQLDEE